MSILFFRTFFNTFPHLFPFERRIPMTSKNPVRKNPSREACEQIIRRILFTELSEHGKNCHFKQASDFMGYFESLYPASDGLTKQVQRAIKALQMPKDDKGYFIPNKTALQLKQEQELSRLFQQSQASLKDLSDCEPLFLQLDPSFHDYVIHLMEQCDTFQNYFQVIVKCSNGLLFYTNKKSKLELLLENLLN